MFRAAIFDMDGVIVDTVPLHFRAWNRMFSEYGQEFSFEDYKEKVDGIPRIDGARAILKKISEKELKKACDRKQNYFLDALKQDDIPVYESTIEFIDELREADIKVAAISSSKNCRYILNKIGVAEKLNTIVDGYDISHGKPNPEIFLLAGQKLNVAPNECVVFEDAVLGVEAAKNANMMCVGIDRYNNHQRLNKAELIINDISEINIDKIKKLFL